MEPVMGDGTIPEDTLTFNSPSVRNVEDGYDKRIPRTYSSGTTKENSVRVSTVVKLSNCDPTRGESLVQVLLYRRRW